MDEISRKKEIIEPFLYNMTPCNIVLVSLMA